MTATPLRLGRVHRVDLARLQATDERCQSSKHPHGRPSEDFNPFPVGAFETGWKVGSGHGQQEVGLRQAVGNWRFMAHLSVRRTSSD